MGDFFSGSLEVEDGNESFSMGCVVLDKPNPTKVCNQLCGMDELLKPMNLTPVSGFHGSERQILEASILP
jgi:hypothetical protein